MKEDLREKYEKYSPAQIGLAECIQQGSVPELP